VSSDHEARLLAGAHDLADLEELADDAVRILGRGRAAGLDPAATGGLVTAATALGASPGDVYAAGRLHRAYPSDREFLEELSLAEEDLTERAAAVSRLQELVASALDAALADVGFKGRDAEKRIELCEEAAGILDQLAPRIRLALARVRTVPADLGETYEAAYDMVRRGGVLPRRGRWITGEDPGGQPARARLPRRRDMLPDLAPDVAAAAAAGLPAWLALHGWEREGDHRGCQVWRLRDQARILIPPADMRYDDTTDLVTTAISTIARHAGTPPRTVLSGATAMAAPEGPAPPAPSPSAPGGAWTPVRYPRSHPDTPAIYGALMRSGAPLYGRFLIGDQPRPDGCLTVYQEAPPESPSGSDYVQGLAVPDGDGGWYLGCNRCRAKLPPRTPGLCPGCAAGRAARLRKARDFTPGDRFISPDGLPAYGLGEVREVADVTRAGGEVEIVSIPVPGTADRRTLHEVFAAGDQLEATQ